MKGIIYTRVSSEEQVKGTSLEFQEEFCRQYCERQNIEVVAVFREEGESAKNLSLNNRQVFLKALEFCRKHKSEIQAFVVLRVDRFARNTEDHFAVRKILMGHGVSLHSVTEPIGNKPAEKFIETVLAGAAEYDNAIRKQRSSDGMSQKINQGIYPWKPPLGYQCRNLKKHGEKKTTPDTPDPHVFPIIQKGLKHYARGFCTQKQLANLLDEWGLKAVRGMRTTPQTVDRILGKYLKFYAGILKNPFTGEDKPGLHTPMITKEEFVQIQFVRSGKSPKLVKHEKFNPEFPLRRIVTCGYCNKFLTGSSPRGHGGKYSYYHCANKQCNLYAKSIAKHVIEEEFVSYLREITPKKNFLDTFRKLVIESWKERRHLFKSASLKHQKRLEDLKTRRKQIFAMREEGSYTKEEFSERKAEVENEIVATKIAMSESRIDQLDIETALHYTEKFIGTLDRQWLDLSHESRLRFQKFLFPEGIPYMRGKGFGTAKLGVIFELNRLSDTSRSSMVPYVRNSWNQIVDELRKWNELTQEIITPTESNSISLQKENSQVKWGKVA